MTYETNAEAYAAAIAEAEDTYGPGTFSNSPEDVAAQAEDPYYTLTEEPTVVHMSGPGAEGILSGGRLTRIVKPEGPDEYVMIYQMPGSPDWVYYEFDPEDSDGDGIPDQIMATFGDNPPYTHLVTEERWNAVEGVSFHHVGNASAIIGEPGSFENLWYEVQRAALQGAGLGDPTIINRLLSDRQYQELVTRAALGQVEMTAPSVLAEFRNLDIYQEIYPGIDFFIDAGYDDPEAQWKVYRARVEPMFRELGIARDSDGSYNSTLKQYLDAGISDDELEEWLPTLKKVQQNPGLKEHMDQWSEYEIGRRLDFDEYLEVLRGTTDPELARIVESASLAFQAEMAGLPITVAEIRQIAELTDLSEREALAAFTTVEAALLATGEKILSSYGLSKGDFLDAFVGIAPRSGMDRATVQALAGKIATERGLSDDPSASFFLGFTDLGVPQRQGLRSLAPRGG